MSRKRKEKKEKKIADINLCNGVHVRMLYLLAQDNNFSKITLNGVSKSSDFSKRDSTRLSDRVVLIPLSLRGKEFVRIESSLLDIQFTRLINDRSYKQRKLQMINRTKRRMIGDDR